MKRTLSLDDGEIRGVFSSQIRARIEELSLTSNDEIEPEDIGLRVR